MRITTQEEHERLLRSRSLILNRPANDIHRPPRFFQCLDFSRQGIERMLQERLDPVTGSLSFWRQEVKRALAAWKTYASRQPRKLSSPIGIWQEQIAKGRARVKVVEEECRVLNKLLEETKAKEANGQKAMRKPRGFVKMKDGRLFQVDGRNVTAGADGESVFEDTGEKVEAYLESLRQRKRARAIAKRTEQRVLADRIKTARASSASPQG